MRFTFVSPPQDAARLYERYADELYRYCLARLRSPEEAEDAVQNTFMRAFRSLDAGVVAEFEAAWLYRIATNVCLSRRELTGRRAQWHTHDDLDQLPVAAPEVDPEAARELIDAVTSLPKNQRDALLLREWRGLSYAEIADSLDTTVPAVETLLVRARRQLASLLRPRKRSAILDVLLLLRLRSWLPAAAPAQLAAGVAVVAVGGVAVGAQIGAAGTAPPLERIAIPTIAQPAPHRTVVPTVRPAAVATRRPARVTPAVAIVRAPAPHRSAPAARARPRSPAPRTDPPAPRSMPAKTTSPMATQPTLAYAEPAPPTATVVSVPAVAVPAVALPAEPVDVAPVDVTTPAVTVPSVTIAAPAPAIASALSNGLLP